MVIKCSGFGAITQVIVGKSDRRAVGALFKLLLRQCYQALQDTCLYSNNQPNSLPAEQDYLTQRLIDL